MSTVPYYSDTFTSDLRWALLVIGAIVVVTILGMILLIGAAAVMAMWPARKRGKKRPIGVGKLPQDYAVKIVPFDQHEAPFDWAEWEERLKR